MAALATVNWAQARTALSEVVPRVTGLLRSGVNPNAPALGQWSVAEVATHLSQAWGLVPALARSEATSPLSDMWDLGAVTTQFVSGDPERNLSALADRIETSAGAFLGSLAGADPDQVGPWLVDGITMPLRVFVCHLLNESLVHGYDMARATGRPWPIKADHASLVFMGFLLPVVGALEPRAMVDQAKAGGLRATYDIRLRGGGGRAFFVFNHGELHIEAPSGRRVHCHLSVDPSAMLLVVWARLSQWPAIAQGSLLAWGLKPWLGPRLRGLMRNP